MAKTAQHWKLKNIWVQDFVVEMRGKKVELGEGLKH